MTLQAQSPKPSVRLGYPFAKYTFFRVDPAWKHLSSDKKQGSKSEFLSVLKSQREKIHPSTYSLVGTRGDVDFLLWTLTESLETLQELHSQLMKTVMGRFLMTPYSYLAMIRPSEYFGKTRDPERVGSKYLFVYPFTKKREWYGLPFEERTRIMRDHVQVGHKYSSVTIHTSYSFGLDDYEFILSFETDHPEDFLNLVMELRTSEASRYTVVETPIFTCISVSPENMLDLLGP